MKLLFTAKHFRELQDKIRSISVDVPDNPKDRKNHHVEIYSLVSLLSSIPWDTSCFPLEVYSQERPDFRIKFNSKEIGLEHTEAVHQNQVMERILRAEGHGPEVHFITAISIHDPVKSSEEILAEINEDKMGDGWCGDSAERNWAEAMAHFINKKVVSAEKEGYDLFGDDRLIIYDNWPTPAVKHHKALPYLRDFLTDSRVWSVFNRIYFVDEDTLVELSAERCVMHGVR
jgi:hypothetical protein